MGEDTPVAFAEMGAVELMLPAVDKKEKSKFSKKYKKAATFIKGLLTSNPLEGAALVLPWERKSSFLDFFLGTETEKTESSWFDRAKGFFGLSDTQDRETLFNPFDTHFEWNPFEAQQGDGLFDGIDLFSTNKTQVETVNAPVSQKEPGVFRAMWQSTVSEIAQRFGVLPATKSERTELEIDIAEPLPEKQFTPELQSGGESPVVDRIPVVRAAGILVAALAARHMEQQAQESNQPIEPLKETDSIGEQASQPKRERASIGVVDSVGSSLQEKTANSTEVLKVAMESEKKKILHTKQPTRSRAEVVKPAVEVAQAPVKEQRAVKEVATQSTTKAERKESVTAAVPRTIENNLPQLQSAPERKTNAITESVHNKEAVRTAEKQTTKETPRPATQETRTEKATAHHATESVAAAPVIAERNYLQDTANEYDNVISALQQGTLRQQRRERIRALRSRWQPRIMRAAAGSSVAFGAWWLLI